MKKNVMLKIASILMVAVLLTTCAISSTFAKYTTEKTDTAEARVARFGVTVKTEISELFATTYGTGEPNVANVADYDITLGTAENAIKVSNLLAPGTAKTINLAETVIGKPEVSVKVTNKVEINVVNFGDYCPIEFIVGTQTFKVGVGEITDVAKLISEVNKAASTEKTYAAGEDLNAATAHDTSIGWKWAFDGNDDVKDTALGDITDLTKVPYVTVSVTTNVTQTGAAVADANN